METYEIERKINSLPDDLKKEVIDFIDFLIMKKKKGKHRDEFNFSWEGGLADIKEKYSSVALQHQSTEWR
jgi:hypothetical protein